MSNLPLFSRSLCVLALCAAPVLAAPAPPVATPPVQSVVSPQRLPLLEVPRAALAPAVSADPSDPAWLQSARIAALGLALGDGSKGLVPLPTQVLAQWDEKFLYVRFVCQDAEVYAPFTVRDSPVYQGDCAEIFLDVVGDARQVVELQLSPSGGIFDQQILLTTEAKSDENLVLTGDVLNRDFWTDLSWNLKDMKTAFARTPKGWIVDFALPAEAILRRRGLKAWAPMTIRANFLRYDWAPDDTDAWGINDATGQKRRLNAHNWAPVKHGSPHISPQAMGFLKLMPGVAPTDR